MVVISEDLKIVGMWRMLGERRFVLFHLLVLDNSVILSGHSQFQDTELRVAGKL